MRGSTLVGIGACGSVVAAICCFTPVLAAVLGAAGLTAWLGWIDDVLLPALALSLALTAYGVWRVRRGGPGCAPGADAGSEGS